MARRIAPLLLKPRENCSREIGQGPLPPDRHQRYHVLREKFLEGQMTDEEHAELLRLSDESEVAMPSGWRRLAGWRSSEARPFLKRWTT